MNPWVVSTIILSILCIYLAVRVYRLRRGLFKILERLDQIERKVPVLKP